jgi:Phage capsid family
MPYTNLIDRTDAGALIPAEGAREIIKATAQASAALTLCRLVRMSSKTFNQPVSSAAPVAYWVTTGLKQTSEAAWAGVTLTAEEIATIIPSRTPCWRTRTSRFGRSFGTRSATSSPARSTPPSWRGSRSPPRARPR